MSFFYKFLMGKKWWPLHFKASRCDSKSKLSIIFLHDWSLIKRSFFHFDWNHQTLFSGLENSEEVRKNCMTSSFLSIFMVIFKINLTFVLTSKNILPPTRPKISCSVYRLRQAAQWLRHKYAGPQLKICLWSNAHIWFFRCNNRDLLFV